MIKNKTKHKIIVSKKRVCSSDWTKAIGLMFSKRKDDFGLIFPFNSERRISLHMFFVFYPIDVLFLDSKKRVIEIKENFKPFKTYYSKKKVKYIIELPYGNIRESNTSVNDLINF